MSNRKYIGVDLGTWYNTTNKTSIAVGYKKDDKLYIEGIYKEYTKQNGDIRTIYSNDKLANILNENNKQVLNNENWNNCLTIDKKNQYLADFLIEQANNNAMIGIDAPFGIPICLFDENKQEPVYIPENESKSNNSKFPNELSNPYIFDNSSRFVYEKTQQIALAPAGDKIGKMTARMIHLSQYNGKELNITKSPAKLSKDNIHTFEVFPTATLYLYIKYLGNNKKINVDDYLEESSSKETKIEDFTKLISYKNENWNKSTKELMEKKIKSFGKNKQNRVKKLILNSSTWAKENKYRMLELLEKFIEFDKKVSIQSDDDYDAIICALTAYLIDKHGYIEPNNKNLFQDSFIYMPDLPKSLQDEK